MSWDTDKVWEWLSSRPYANQLDKDSWAYTDGSILKTINHESAKDIYDVPLPIVLQLLDDIQQLSQNQPEALKKGTKKIVFVKSKRQKKKEEGKEKKKEKKEKKKEKRNENNNKKKEKIKLNDTENKKRKREDVVALPTISHKTGSVIEKIKRTKIATIPTTISVAIPGSIAANAPSRELRIYLVGQIARALSIFKVSEIIIFEDQESAHEKEKAASGMGRDPCLFMVRVLEYLETPPHLRKPLFPNNYDLTHAELLNPLDALHHVRADEDSLFREGIVLDRPRKKGRGSQVDIGLRGSCTIDKVLKPGVRVTVEIEDPEGSINRKRKKGKAVAPSYPREKNMYWGYTTRLCHSMSEIWTQCPYKNGYDFSIGTSERGENIISNDFKLPSCNHLLIVLGGLSGLESCIASDDALKTENPEELFDVYINACPNQGSRTIRTEEALLIVLSTLQMHIFK